PSTTLALKAVADPFPFDPQKDFTSPGVIGTFQTAIATSRTIDVRSLAEYVDWVKAGDTGRTRLGITLAEPLLSIYCSTIGRAARHLPQGRRLPRRRTAGEGHRERIASGGHGRADHLSREPSRSQDHHAGDLRRQTLARGQGYSDGDRARLPQSPDGRVVRHVLAGRRAGRDPGRVEPAVAADPRHRGGARQAPPARIGGDRRIHAGRSSRPTCHAAEQLEDEGCGFEDQLVSRSGPCSATSPSAATISPRQRLSTTALRR